MHFTRKGIHEGLYAYTTSKKGQLLPHHHIIINAEMRGDLEMWRTFMSHQSIYARSFMDFSKYMAADEIIMYSDTAKSPKLGFGGICGDSWMYSQWPNGFIKSQDPSIGYLELFTLVMTVINWIHRFANKRVILFCDNQSVIQMVNNTTSSCPNCMVLIRMLVLKSLTENVRIFARYIRSKDNVASDLLSRLKISEFKQLK